MPQEPIDSQPWPEPGQEIGLTFFGRWTIIATIKTIEGARPPSPPRCAANRPGQGKAVPWQGNDWDALEPLVRRLLTYMHGREQVHLDYLCAAVWGKGRGDGGVTDSAISTALSKANAFLGQREWRRVLEKPRGEELVRWA
jgi:hypothetical protein